MHAGRFEDTIAAVATAPGRGGVGIVRLSGPQAFSVTARLTERAPENRTATLVSIRDRTGERIDEGLLLHFHAPHSFTGEDVAELQCHGGPVVLATILRECIEVGARQAEPGEFTKRAFLNNKIDLLQAEAIADLIASDTEAAARSASRSLAGDFSSRVNEILDDLVGLRVFIEAAIDFPEEEIDFIADSDVLERLENLDAQISDLLAAARRGRRLRDGMKLVIAGAPNVGKSSLLNALAGQETAIVTNIPGTTRDVLREHIEIDGLPLHIVDTAGLRDASDEVEKEGIRRARAELTTADRILLVTDASLTAESDIDPASFLPEERGSIPVTLIRNKIDLVDRGDDTGNLMPPIDADVVLNLSVADGTGMDQLRQHLLDSAGLGSRESSDFSARERHLSSLEACLGHLGQGLIQLREHGAAELIAEDLRYAQDALGAITGRFHSDELLGEIFSSFCIGK